MNRLYFCILFTVVSSLLVAATWTGSTSTSWNTPSNWNPASVPTSTTDVTVPNVTNKPVINATATCRNLTIQTGSSVTLNNTYNLTVTGTMAVSGALNMSSSGDLYATGNFFWESGATASITSSSASIIASGNMQFHASSNVQIASGTIQFTGSTATTDLANFSTLTQIYSLYVTKSAGTSFSIRTGSQPFTVNGHISNELNSTFYNYFTGNITLKGNISDYNTDPAYGIKWDNGTLIMDGTGPSIGVRSATCYLKNLTFSQSGTAQLTYPLTLKGKLRIESGVFYPQAHNITLAGDWENVVGPAAFTEGTTARVTFNGTSHQLVNYSETFNILEVNSSAALRINSSSAVVTCAQYDWTAGGIDVLEGTFTANDLADSGIFGSYWVNPGGIINLTNTDSWVDLNGSMTFTNGGTINVYGGTGTSDWSYGGNANLTMNGPGILDFKNVGINIYNSITYTLNCSINDADAKIRTIGSFTCSRSSFAPVEGWLEMYGSADATLTMNSGTLCKLRINKTATREEESTPMPTFITDARSGISREVTRANTVNLATNVTCAESLSLDYGTLNLQSYQFNCCIAVIYSTLKMNNASAKFYSNGDIYWQSTSIADITLGTLETTAAWQAVGNALVILPAAVETRLICTGNSNISITTANMQFGNLVVGSASPGGVYTMGGGNPFSLFVVGNLTITAGNELDVGTCHLTVFGTLNLNGKLDIHATTTTVHGKPYLETTSNLTIDSGEFYCDEGNILPRTTYLKGILSINSGTLNLVHNSLTVNAGSTNTLTSGTIYCDGITALTAGTFQPAGGTIVMGNLTFGGTSSLQVTNGNWLPSLTIDAGIQGYYLAANLIVKGNLTLLSGGFDVQNAPTVYNITISGNWSHQGGTFYPRTGRVIFTGTAAQYCNYTETFNILEVNKAYDLFYVNSSSAVVTCAQYDWTAGGVHVSYGTFTANDLADSGIYGSIYATSGATINLTNNDSYVDLNGTMGISGSSSVNIYGGTTTSDWSYGGNAALTMNSGTLDFKNRGIRIYNSPSYTFTSNISGGVIRTVGGLEVNRSGFEPSGGILELYGSTDASLTMSYGNLHNLRILKDAARDEENLPQQSLRIVEKDGSILELTRSNTVNLGSNIDVNGFLSIQSGVLNASTLSINVGGDWYNSVGDSGFLEGQSTVVFNGDSIQYIYSTERFWNLTLAKTGVPTVLQQANGVDAYVANDMNLVNGYYIAGFPSNNYVKNLYIQSLAGFITSYDLFVSGNMYDYNTTYEGIEGFCPQGVLTFNGTGSQIVSRSGPEIRVNIMTIDKPAGTRCYFDKPVKLNYSLNIYGGIWQDMGNNFVHELYGNLNVWPNGAIANDTNNTFTFVGNEHQYIAYEGAGSLTNVVINKTESARTSDLAAASDSGTVNRSVDITLGEDLVLANSGNLTIENGNLHSAGWDIICTGNFNISGSTAAAYIESGSNLTVNGALNLNGKLDIQSASASVQGKPVFATTSNLTIVDGSLTYYDSSIPRDTHMRGILNLTNSTLNAVNNVLRFEATSTNNITGTSLIYCDGIYATGSGNFQPLGGTVIITENPSHAHYSLNVSNGNWLHNFVIGTDTGVILASNLIIKGFLQIESGNLDVSSSNYSITIGGEWTNLVGESGFTQRNGRVIFNGTASQHCNNSETFHILELNCAEFLFFYNDTAVVTCDQYDWTAGGIYVSAGTFTAHDLADHGIYGGVYAIGTGTINLTNNDSYVDLNGTMYISDTATVNIYGGTSPSDWAFGGNATINMTGGVLDFKNRGIRINDSLTYTFTANIGGGVIRTVGGLEVYRSGFEPWGGTLELYGSTDASLIMNYGNLYNLNINKAVSRDEDNLSQESLMAMEKDGSIRELTRSNTVNLGSNLVLANSGNLTIENGNLHSAGWDITCNGNFSVNSSTAAAYIEAGSILRMATSKNLNVNAGLLNLTGSATEPVTVTSISGFYNFNVESGANLSAIYTTFEKMTSSGVNVKNGALVNTTDPFKNCIFQNGAAGGTLLTLNSNQILNIDNAVFPTNTWSGTNNVKKTMNWGTVNFNLATGAFSGAAFESDTYNRINWLGGNPDLRITSITWPNNNPYICDAITATVYVQNNSTTNITTPFRVDLYKNRSTPPPVGLMGDSYMTITSLAAGVTTAVTFSNVSTDVPGVWSSWFQVDANGLIAESNESNNVWTPAISTTWNALPIVNNLEAERSGSNVQLNWSYPISVYRYKIYKDTNPNGSFSTLAGTSTTPSFSQAFSGTKWFYRVRAERLLP